MKGFDKEVCDIFSTGAKRVETAKERYAEKGLSKQGKAKVQLFDRPEKAADKPLEQRHAGWLSRMTHEQFDGIKSVVSAAKRSVKLSGLREGLRNYATRLRSYDRTVEPVSRDRSRKHEGWTR